MIIYLYFGSRQRNSMPGFGVYMKCRKTSSQSGRDTLSSTCLRKIKDGLYKAVIINQIKKIIFY